MQYFLSDEVQSNLTGLDLGTLPATLVRSIPSLHSSPNCLARVVCWQGQHSRVWGCSFFGLAPGLYGTCTPDASSMPLNLLLICLLARENDIHYGALQIESVRAQVAQMTVTPSNSSTAAPAGGPSGKLPPYQHGFRQILLVRVPLCSLRRSTIHRLYGGGWYSCPACEFSALQCFLQSPVARFLVCRVYIG